MWIGLAKTGKNAEAPFGVSLALPSHRILSLVRYREGTLRYDEIFYGCLGRIGWRIGILVERIWVDSEASLWGGRKIWGLPKEMAEFSWTGDTVRIRDQGGDLLTVSVPGGNSRTPVVGPLPVGGLTRIDGRWHFIPSSLKGRFIPCGFSILDSSPRLPFHKARLRMGLSARPFEIEVRSPIPL